MREVWIQDQNPVRAILAWKHSPYEM
uniref:Uncharacterized protein n=1 Tax=Rhizophora mucronata TaxID=61149 RepID=A0A2P2MPR3_RHIMU